MVKLSALPVHQSINSKVPKDQTDTLENKVLDLLKRTPEITQVELAEKTNVSIPSVKRVMKKLSESGVIVRVGGRRYGHWEVNNKESLHK